MERTQNQWKRRLCVLSVLALVALAVSATTAVGAGEPSIAFNPSTYDYGAVDVGTTASKTFVLTAGKRATSELRVELFTDSPVFAVTADSCTGNKLAANKSCSVTVQFAPTTTGTHHSAQLFAVSTKPLLNAVATLTGGVSPGCAAVNGTLFDRDYINAGLENSFKSGETVTISAGALVSGAPPTQVNLFVDGVVADTASYPGTVEYVVPASGVYGVGWATDSLNAIVTWTASCTA